RRDADVERDLVLPRQPRARVGVAERRSRFERGDRDRPVHRARVENGQTERARNAARDRRLARSGRTVDRDDARRGRGRSRHDAPVTCARSSAKPGYDTDTACQPRTVLSPSIALAATAAAIAIRWSP